MFSCTFITMHDSSIKNNEIVISHHRPIKNHLVSLEQRFMNVYTHDSQRSMLTRFDQTSAFLFFNKPPLSWPLLVIPSAAAGLVGEGEGGWLRPG